MDPINTMKSTLPLLLAGAFVAMAGSQADAAQGHRYSKQVQKACVNDYKRYCGEYGIETQALRLCMDRVGHRLTKSCVNALVASGEVSQAEVNRRKRASR